MATTVGETAADFLNVNLQMGLMSTSLITALLLQMTLGLQFRSQRYTPWGYWSSIVLISVFGTLATDNLVDNVGVTLETTPLVQG